LIRRITILSFNLILHILFMVVDAGGINGVLRAIDFLEKKYTISAYLAFIEIFLHSANIIVISHYLITKNYLLK
jgi:hypothetical protein